MISRSATGVAALDEQERKNHQRAARDRHLNDIEQSLNHASKTIQESQRQVARTHDLLRDRREQDARDDKEDDDRDRLIEPPRG